VLLDSPELNARLVSAWVASLKPKRRGQDELGSSSHNSARSAIKHLYTIYDVVQSAEMEASLSKFFRSLKRTTNTARAAGNGRVQVGKDPMPFALMSELALTMLKSGNREDVFTHLYMLLSWNLMCRSNNTAGICFNHIRLVDDAIAIHFPKSKTDQEGDLPQNQEARHVYSNPQCPQLDVFLSLGIYLLTFPIAQGQKKLFVGSKQDERYGCYYFFFDFFLCIDLAWQSDVIICMHLSIAQLLYVA